MSAPRPQQGNPMNNKNVILIVVLVVAAVALLVVFNKRSTGGNVGRELDKAGESIKDAVTPDGPAEKAGKKVDNAVDAIKD